MASSLEAAVPIESEEHQVVGSEETAEATVQRLRNMVEAHFDFLWRLVRRLGVPVADVDDVTQRVFWVAARRLDRIVPKSERAYLCATAMRVASDFRRAHVRNRSRECLDDELVDLAVDATVDIETLVDQKKARAMLDRLLDELPIDLRTVLVLAEGEQMTMAEIGELLSIPPGTVASRLRRARAAFDAHVDQIAGRTRCRETP